VIGVDRGCPPPAAPNPQWSTLSGSRYVTRAGLSRNFPGGNEGAGRRRGRAAGASPRAGTAQWPRPTCDSPGRLVLPGSALGGGGGGSAGGSIPAVAPGMRVVLQRRTQDFLGARGPGSPGEPLWLAGRPRPGIRLGRGAVPAGGGLGARNVAGQGVVFPEMHEVHPAGGLISAGNAGRTGLSGRLDRSHRAKARPMARTEDGGRADGAGMRQDEPEMPPEAPLQACGDAGQSAQLEPRTKLIL